MKKGIARHSFMPEAPGSSMVREPLRRYRLGDPPVPDGPDPRGRVGQQVIWMPEPNVYPLTSPRTQNTARIAAMVISMGFFPL